jgi:hypothetical protein
MKQFQHSLSIISSCPEIFPRTLLPFSISLYFWRYSFLSPARLALSSATEATNIATVTTW